MANLSKTTNDHEEIRRWAEERGGHPASVKGTGNEGDIGLLRIDFPGYSGEDSLQEITWDEFFEKFDKAGLSLLYQEETAGGERSNFNKLVSAETAAANEEHAHAAGGPSPAKRAGAKKVVSRNGAKSPAKKVAGAAKGVAQTPARTPLKTVAKPAAAKTTVKAAKKKAASKSVPAKQEKKAVKKSPAGKGLPKKAARKKAVKRSVKKATPKKTIARKAASRTAAKAAPKKALKKTSKKAAGKRKGRGTHAPSRERNR